MVQPYMSNAAAAVYDLGIEDLSTKILSRLTETLPQHIPKQYIYAKRGIFTPHLARGAERELMYGKDTFDLRSKYANHATALANLFDRENNPCMYQRVKPADIGPKANMTVWLDVLPTTVDLYERLSDGSIKYVAGNPVITGTTSGYKVKFVVTNSSDHEDFESFGNKHVVTGNQSAGGVTSQRYPIFELAASSEGDDGNNTGVRLWAPTSIKSTLPTKLMAEQRAYPYTINVVRRKDVRSAPKVQETIFAERDLGVSFKEGVTDPLTDKQWYIGDSFLESYRNLTDLRYPISLGDIGTLAVYTGNIETLLADFHAAESDFIDSHYDFTASEDDIHLFNFIGGTTSDGTPYHSFRFVDSQDSVRFSEFTNLYLAGGSDGTLNDANFAELVSEQVLEYANPNSPLMDIATNVESHLYDSGFPLDTKEAMASFIAIRKDTFVVLSTHDVNERNLTSSEEHSLAVSLRTHLQMYAESDYFGTPTVRGLIQGRSAILRNSQFRKRLPLTAEIAVKSARYMGDSSGSWRTGAAFDMAPGSTIEDMIDISIGWIPTSVRNRSWDAGLNWVQPKDRRSHFFPMLKTIYPDDTSVLNSYITVCAICYLNKIAHSCWREFSGVSSLTNAQLVDRVNAFVTNAVKDKFDGRFVIQPDAQMTDMDKLRGFSWTLPIKIYAPNMKTVMTAYVKAYRLDDLVAVN